MAILVLKFGGAAVAHTSSFAHIASLIAARNGQCDGIAVIVSAMRGVTDQLIALAKAVNPQPPQREYDMLVTVGERISCSLLAMALAAQGFEALSYTGSQAGIITCERHADAKILDVRPHRLLEPLSRKAIPIIAGFQGVSSQGAITSLGRGGSDTTAVALAIALGAQKVEFYKDVPGIYSADPKKVPDAKHHPHLTYDAALSIALQTGPVLHPRSLQLAERNALPLQVLSFSDWQNPNPLSTTISFSHHPHEPSRKPTYETS